MSKQNTFNLREHRNEQWLSKYREIKTVNVPIPKELLRFQKTKKWCWAATLEMLFAAYGIHVSQDELAVRAHGLDVEGNPIVSSASDKVIDSLLNQTFKCGNRYVNISSQKIEGPPAGEVIVKELYAKRPVIVSYQSGQSVKHAVMITNASFFIENRRFIITRLAGFDPWPLNGGIVNYDVPANLASRISRVWLVRFANSSKFAFELARALSSIDFSS